MQRLNPSSELPVCDDASKKEGFGTHTTWKNIHIIYSFMKEIQCLWMDLHLDLKLDMCIVKAVKSSVLPNSNLGRQLKAWIKCLFFSMFLLFCYTVILFAMNHLCVWKLVNVFIHMWLCWYVMQDTTVQLKFCQCKGKDKFLRLKTSVNQGSIAGTHVGKRTAVVKIVKIFQTKY